MDNEIQTETEQTQQTKGSKKTLVTIGVILAILVIGAFLFLTKNKSPQSGNSSTPGGTTGQTQKSYSLTDVASHNQESDCWMAIEGKVYDITDFVNKHPGGKMILQGCGTDATEIFNNRPGGKGAHSALARKTLENLFIGNLAN